MIPIGVYFSDNFSEKTGIARVVEALQCAEWVNMEIEGIVLAVIQLCLVESRLKSLFEFSCVRTKMP